MAMPQLVDAVLPHLDNNQSQHQLMHSAMPVAKQDI